MRESLHEVLDFVDEMINDLGSRDEMNYLRDSLEDLRGAGADRQAAIYEQAGDMGAVPSKQTRPTTLLSLF